MTLLKVMCALPLFLILACHQAFAKYDATAPHWRAVVESRVKMKGTESRVDYAGLKTAPNDLDAYIQEVQAVKEEEFDAMSKEERLAFLINAYNAFSVKMVIENYPVKSFSSIGGTFANPWRKKSEFKLFEKPVALDDIEMKKIPAIEGMGPRFHFAICKTAKDSPRLLNEPYLASKLNEQLADAARVFITDRLKNGYTSSSNSFEVSQLFRWYKSDFESSAGAGGSLAKYLAQNFELDPPLSAEAVKKASVKFVDFDWTLNTSTAKP